jgi:hypothetical protein
MSWTTAPSDGQIIYAATIADIIAKQSSWGGNVAANGYNLTGCGTISGDSIVATKATGSTEIQIANTAGTADTGLRITDSTRSWKLGVNVGVLGAGKLYVYNITASTPLAAFDDTSCRFYGQIYLNSALPGPYANNAAAVAAGLTAGRLYQDSSNNVKQVQ